ncbi:hypothetical protein GCM10008014_53580 [Paenibacillus silvae]|uniref:Uncharacterized protein n=1 Tax=Paenibacillus silvae TaxID=1325358 RepID=A0ABQ1ZKE4_9BACL|nr:hypothetical protein [Paenibacillus silvae]GGH69795.1 hypothetical protein GCM10008014_53580 [Paenibacillus silvae]
MKLKKIRFVLLASALTLGISAAASANGTASANGIIDNNSVKQGQANTLDKGYQLVNGNVYDKYGNLLIVLKNGLTPDGYTLSPDFSVVYGDNTNKTSFSSKLAVTGTEIFNGTKSVPKNTNGNQGVQLGSEFSFTSTEPDLYVEYTSGTVDGVNFSLNNVTTGSVVKWFSNVQVGSSNGQSYKGAYNSSRPNDKFSVKASGQGGSGNLTLLVQTFKSN